MLTLRFELTRVIDAIILLCAELWNVYKIYSTQPIKNIKEFADKEFLSLDVMQGCTRKFYTSSRSRVIFIAFVLKNIKLIWILN